MESGSAEQIGCPAGPRRHGQETIMVQQLRVQTPVLEITYEEAVEYLRLRNKED